MNKKVFEDKKVVVGITGGIAAYKVLDIIKEIKNLGGVVHVIMTESATKMVDPKEFELASGNEVKTSLFDPSINYQDYLSKDEPINHISLADIADAFVVCPATANVLGKVAGGVCDDLLTTSLSATSAPIIFCPAMNVKMWHNPFTQQNVKKLSQHDYHFVEPEYGELACGYQGMGRLADGEKILEQLSSLLVKQDDFKGKKVIVTAGATSEPIDAVRFITNKSSGKMGVAIAEQLYRRKAEVFLIRAAHSVIPRYPIKEETITTADELRKVMEEKMKDADMVIHAAAVSDFTPAPQEGKVKSDKTIHLELSPTTKILENIKKWNPNAFLVGFKAEHDLSQEELGEKAHELLISSQADMIVANDIAKEGRGFDVDTNEVLIVDKEKHINPIPLARKNVIADKVLDYIAMKLVK